MRIVLVKNLIWLLPSMLVFQQCARVNTKKPTSSPANEGDTTLATHVVKELSPEELDHYRQLVKSHLDSTFGRSRFNGMFLVAKSGQIIYEQYTGFTNPRTRKDSITASTPLHLASVSKTFTGMAVLKLWEQGKLNIDDPVSNYLTGFPLPAVTVRMLL